MKKFKLVKDKNSFQIHWEKKAINEKRDEKGNEYLEIEGYASTKDKDRWNDIVEPKAFEKALATYMTNPIVLLQHKHDKPIGVVTDAKIDNKGLYIKANITENTDNVMSAIRNGVLRTFSIGYGLKEGDYEINEFIDENGNADYTATIKNLELYEISVVSVPMNAYALMKSIEDCFETEEVEDEENGKNGAEEEKKVEVKAEEENSENEWEEISEEMHSNDEGEKVDENENLDEKIDEDLDEDEEKEETLTGNINLDLKEESTEENKEESEEQKEEYENIFDDEKKEVEEEKEVEDKGEENKADENSEIESTEVVEDSENEVETPTNDNVSDEKSTDGVIESKAMDEDSQEKSFKIDEKHLDEMIQKRLSVELEGYKKEMENQKSELEKVKNVLKSAIQVIGEMDGALRQTVIKTGATYSQVAKRKSARGEVVKEAQKAL